MINLKEAEKKIKKLKKELEFILKEESKVEAKRKDYDTRKYDFNDRTRGERNPIIKKENEKEKEKLDDENNKIESLEKKMSEKKSAFNKKCKEFISELKAKVASELKKIEEEAEESSIPKLEEEKKRLIEERKKIIEQKAELNKQKDIYKKRIAEWEENNINKNDVLYLRIKNKLIPEIEQRLNREEDINKKIKSINKEIQELNPKKLSENWKKLDPLDQLLTTTLQNIGNHLFKYRMNDIEALESKITELQPEKRTISKPKIETEVKEQPKVESGAKEQETKKEETTETELHLNKPQIANLKSEKLEKGKKYFGTNIYELSITYVINQCKKAIENNDELALRNNQKLLEKIVKNAKNLVGNINKMPSFKILNEEEFLKLIEKGEKQLEEINNRLGISEKEDEDVLEQDGEEIADENVEIMQNNYALKKEEDILNGEIQEEALKKKALREKLKELIKRVGAKFKQVEIFIKDKFQKVKKKLFKENKHEALNEGNTYERVTSAVKHKKFEEKIQSGVKINEISLDKVAHTIYDPKNERGSSRYPDNNSGKGIEH